MDASDILKQQQTWLDTLQKQLAKPSESGILALLGNRQQQQAAIQARIDDLSRQKDAAMQRYDAAIEQQKSMLVLLQGAAATGGSVLQGSQAAPPPKTG